MALSPIYELFGTGLISGMLSGALAWLFGRGIAWAYAFFTTP